MPAHKKSKVPRIEFRERLKAIEMSHARFAHERGWSLASVREYLAASATRAIPYYMETALIDEEGWYAIDLLIAGKGKRASKYALKAIRAKTKMGTKPPKRRRAKRKPRKVNFLAPRFLSPAAPIDELEQPATWQQLAQRIGADEAQRLHTKLAQRRPRGPGRPVDDGDAPPRTRTTEPI
jgi:hypothetical protein